MFPRQGRERAFQVERHSAHRTRFQASDSTAVSAQCFPMIMQKMSTNIGRSREDAGIRRLSHALGSKPVDRTSRAFTLRKQSFYVAIEQQSAPSRLQVTCEGLNEALLKVAVEYKKNWRSIP